MSNENKMATAGATSGVHKQELRAYGRFAVGSIAWLDALCESRAELTCRNYRLEGKLLTASTAFLSASGDKIKWM